MLLTINRPSDVETTLEITFQIGELPTQTVQTFIYANTNEFLHL